MIISVDTKKDSADDIRKAISFLKTFLDESGSQVTEEQSPSLGVLFNEGESEKKEEPMTDKDVQIIPY